MYVHMWVCSGGCGLGDMLVTEHGRPSSSRPSTMTVSVPIQSHVTTPLPPKASQQETIAQIAPSTAPTWFVRTPPFRLRKKWSAPDAALRATMRSYVRPQLKSSG